MRFEKNISDRRELVRRLEMLTGQRSTYTQLPRCAYEVGPFTVEKDGTLSVELSDESKPVIQILLRENMIKGELPRETVWVADGAWPAEEPDAETQRIIQIRPRKNNKQPVPESNNVQNHPYRNECRTPLPGHRPSREDHDADDRMPTVQEWFDDLRCDYERSPANALTQKSHAHHFGKNVKPVMGSTPLNEVTGEQVEAVYRLMEQRKYAPNTINGVYEMMAMIFNSAIRAGYIETSPTIGHTYPTGRIIQGYEGRARRNKHHETEQ